MHLDAHRSGTSHIRKASYRKQRDSPLWFKGSRRSAAGVWPVDGRGRACRGVVVAGGGVEGVLGVGVGIANPPDCLDLETDPTKEPLAPNNQPHARARP
jgi:hypothetical protein